MKKKILLISILVLSLLFLSSCKKTRYAYVTIFNDGVILITAMVDDDASLINPGEGVEWTLSWEGSKTITVQLYAEPVGFNDSDEVWVTLSNGQDYTWEPGWVFGASSGLKKKKDIK
ncbi:MAG: hypothetical protein KAT34_06670 [Candidatus Aminicenantes bacterium]|nr:hypothetical protein [Candidatus Aminicenantes bacterium]